MRPLSRCPSAREVDLPRHLDYAAVAVPRLRKVFRALETHPAPYVEVGAGLFHPHMVGGCLEYRYVCGVFGVEGIDGVLELLLGKRVVFVRHPYVPEYVAVSRLRNERVVGELGVIIREYRDYLELPCGAVVVCLKIVCPVVVVPESGKLAPFLEAHTLDKAGDLIVIGIERQVAVLEIVYGEVLAVVAFFWSRSARS